jgi:hypothetical protein
MTTAAYGFRIDGAADSRWLSLRGAESWPLLRIERDPAMPAAALPRIDERGFTATVTGRRPDDELLHPHLGTLALMLAERRGTDSMHAGAVLGPEGAWALVGTKQAGKSTLLGSLAQSGATVLADDVLVMKAGRVLAGPRLVDLRPSAARQLGASTVVRGGMRRRLLLPPAPAESELAGLVYLGWGGEPSLEPLRAPERLARLMARREQDGWPRSRELLLDLASLPAFELRRPKRWDALSTAVNVLGSLLEPPARAA